MAIEVIVKRYFIEEKKFRTYHDTPAIGCYQTNIVDEKQYGPYENHSEAEQTLSSLKAEKERQGWKISQAKKCLCLDDFEICYDIKNKTQTVYSSEKYS